MKQHSYLLPPLFLLIVLLNIFSIGCSKKSQNSSPPKNDNPNNKEEIVPDIAVNIIFELKKNLDNTYTIIGLKEKYIDTTKVIIPVQIEGIDVSTIGTRAFWNTKVNDVFFEPNSVLHTIENEAFAYSKLERITLPNSLQNIEFQAFSNCINLKEIVLGNQLQSLSEYVFASCTSIANIGIPNSVKTIAYGAFQGCSNLVSIHIDINNSQLNRIGDFAFHNCKKIKDVNLPNSLTSIGEKPFFNCINLSKISIGNNNALSIQSIFANIEKLDIYCTATTPPIVIKSLSISTIKDINIFVPADKVEDYKKAEGWIQYANRIKAN